MFEIDESLVLEVLSEHVLDRKEIATVSWLSKSQNMSACAAKKCLKTFFSRYETKLKPVYYLTYFVNNELNVALSCSECPESLKDFKVISKDLFSVQAFEPKDLACLSLPLQDENYLKPVIRYPDDNLSKCPADQGSEVVPSGKASTVKSSISAKTSTAPLAKQTSKSKSRPLQSMFSSATSTVKTGADSKKSSQKSSEKTKTVEECTSNASPNGKRGAAEVTEQRSPPSKKVKQSTNKHRRVIMDDSDEEDSGLADKQDTAESIDDNNIDTEGDKSPLKENVSSPEEKGSPAKVIGAISKSRRRRKVLKDVTHVDEDGFLITDKVWQEESCSEEEEISSSVDANSNTVVKQGSLKLPQLIFNDSRKSENVTALIKNKEKSKKNATGNAKKSQGSLMSFFGKKN